MHNLSFQDYENLQNVDISEIICQTCRIRNKGIIYNNEFYRCLTCISNLCPDCKLKHDQNHKIIDYDKKNYICNKHKKNFVKYCENCKEDICLSCESSHRNHKLIYFGDVLPDGKMTKELNELKDNIDSINIIINDIISKFENVKKNFEIYYHTFDSLIKIYNNENSNYKLIKNINEFINNNKFLIEQINKIKYSFNLERCLNLMRLYNKMNKNKNENINLNNNIRIIDVNNKNNIINKNIKENKFNIIIDNGSSSIKFGLSGDEYEVVPKISTCIGYLKENNGKDINLIKEYYIGDELEEKRDNFALKYPMERGIIKDWDIMEKLYDNIFFNKLEVNTSEHNVFITELPYNSKKNRENLLEYMFEVYDVPGLYIANTSYLTLFAAGEFTGLVVDLGDSYNHFYPIFDGYSTKNAKWSKSAGKDLTEYLYHFLKLYGQNIKYLEYAKIIKEKACYIPMDYEEEIKSVKPIEYKLPDSTSINIKDLRIKCPELLFNSDNNDSIAKTCIDIIKSSKLEIQKDLLNCIVLSGGNSMFPGLGERLTKEIKILAPENLKEKVKVICPLERQYSSFIGGQILSSLSSLKWIEKKDYEENGKSIVHKMCPIMF